MNQRERLSEIFSYHSSMFEPVSTRPWKLGPWLWATNGHLLVALSDDGTPSIETPGERIKGRRYIEETPEGLTPIRLADLRAFAGPIAPATTKCDSCGGSGYNDGEFVKCEHCGVSTRIECGFCGGDGNGTFPTRYARVAGVPLNLVLLAYALSFVPNDDDANVGTFGFTGDIKNREFKALGVVAPTWRVVVMGIREPLNNVAEFPLAMKAHV